MLPHLRGQGGQERRLCRAARRSRLHAGGRHPHRMEAGPFGCSTKDARTIAEDLHALGIALRILTGTLAGSYSPKGEGKFFFTMMVAFAELERDMIVSAPGRVWTLPRLRAGRGGRPSVMDADKLAAAKARKAKGRVSRSLPRRSRCPARRCTGRLPTRSDPTSFSETVCPPWADGLSHVWTRGPYQGQWHDPLVCGMEPLKIFREGHSSWMLMGGPLSEPPWRSRWCRAERQSSAVGCSLDSGAVSSHPGSGARRHPGGAWVVDRASRRASAL